MYTLRARNVNEALQLGMQLLKAKGIELNSRNGPTVEIAEPVTTTYIYPWERVLFSAQRDANPFFHFFESLWILAGRRDVAFVQQFNSNIANYSDNGTDFHGAYGYRMRSLQGFDQLISACEMLKRDPETRRCVIQLWNASADMTSASKDIPCNDMVMFRARRNVIDMTVCNRSNDIIWGAYGANAVHFSVLHEFVAAYTGLHMGSYHQVSNSFHAYTNNPYWQFWERPHWLDDAYVQGEGLLRVPLFNHPGTVLEELYRMFKAWDYSAGKSLTTNTPNLYQNAAIATIALPMFEAWQQYKDKNFSEAKRLANDIEAHDWRIACQQWLHRREQRHAQQDN